MEALGATSSQPNPLNKDPPNLPFYSMGANLYSSWPYNRISPILDPMITMPLWGLDNFVPASQKYGPNDALAPLDGQCFVIDSRFV